MSDARMLQLRTVYLGTEPVVNAVKSCKEVTKAFDLYCNDGICR